MRVYNATSLQVRHESAATRARPPGHHHPPACHPAGALVCHFGKSRWVVRCGEVGSVARCVVGRWGGGESLCVCGGGGGPGGGGQQAGCAPSQQLGLTCPSQLPFICVQTMVARLGLARNLRRKCRCQAGDVQLVVAWRSVVQCWLRDCLHSVDHPCAACPPGATGAHAHQNPNPKP